MNKIKISIIIPHYRSVPLLKRALESIGTAADTEVIVVDDKSNLDSGERSLLEEICSGEGRFLYDNTTDRKGAGVCRNIGLSHARGEWLLFVDADDFLVEGWYERVKEYTEKKPDLVYFPPTDRNDATGEKSGRTKMYEELVTGCRRKPTHRHLTELKYSFCTPWSKLIRRSVVTKHDIRFDETPVSNDIMFMTKCAFYAEKCAVAKEPVYCATRSGNTLTSKKSKENFKIRIEVLSRRYAFLKQNLSKADFRSTHIGQLVFGQMVCVFADGYGFGTFLWLLSFYREHKMKILGAGFLDPVSFIRKAKMLISWFGDIKKARKKQ
ncbi:MAG: glycosyltransferase [Lachnospiraceae bacterium]|nr:glycosyltransferase [Lachnospiraceae bacterium]